ncbi:phospholipase-like protein [Artemisia annua]|uniref:Phospholipase-like protein n=1 Tax=Artemisia annua TaxID=35608 RepID=A0A2U1NG87_ARTAN|nr:phospholipase-like protein [Artemisia annua]
MFEAKITVRSKLHYFAKIKGLLKGNRMNLFRETVFGPWLDFPTYYPDNHLYNYFYQNQVRVPVVSDHCRSLIFEIGDKALEFGREQFSLITGFSLGHVAKEEIDIGRLVHGLKESPFFDRLFPQKKLTQKKKIKGEQLLQFLNNAKLWESLSDDDAVRVCLLVIATFAFIGREGRYYIPDHLLKNIEDFDVWNDYPWGEYMWAHFFLRTVNVVPRHNEFEAKKAAPSEPKTEHTYNLYGFVWALKIWITESYPNRCHFWTKDPEKIPRAIAWSKIHTKFDKKDYSVLFHQDAPPLQKLFPTNAEMKCRWYIRSVEYMRKSVDDLPLPVSDDEDRNMLAVTVYGGEGAVNDNPVAGGNEGDGETSMLTDVPELIIDDVVGGHPDDHEITNDNQEDVKKDVPEPSSVNVGVSPDRSLVVPRINKELIAADVKSIKSKVGLVEKQVGDVDGKHLLDEISILKMRIGAVERAVGIKFEDNFEGLTEGSPVDGGQIKLDAVDFPKNSLQGDECQLDNADVETPLGTNPVAESVRATFHSLKRKRNPAKYFMSPFTALPDTTPKRRRSSRLVDQNISPLDLQILMILCNCNPLLRYPIL